MENLKKLLIYIRNGLALIFSWLVICTIIASLTVVSGAISAVYLIKLFVLSLWAVLSFAVCFKTNWAQKKGFIFSLTLFYIMFIPAEIAMFYYMGIFSTAGNISSWLIFAGIVLGAYIVSLIVDFFIMKKQAILYTEKVRAFNTK